MEAEKNDINKRQRSAIVDRFTAHGERVVVDFHIIVDGNVVASLENEAIISLP